LTRLLYAAFARMRDDPKRMAAVWLNATGLLGAIVLPMIFGLIAVAPDVIPLAFGRQWTPAVPVVQILCVFVAARALQAWNASVIDAAGKPHFSMFSMAAVLLVLPVSIWLGSSFSIEGVAVFYVLTILLFAELPSFVFTSHELGVRQREVVARLGGVFLCSVLMSCLVALVRVALEREGVGVGVRLSLSIAAGILFYGVSLRFFAPSIFRQLLRMARQRGRSWEPLDAPAADSES
jgi:O-antigen/teichoic acid export membrane protein